MRRARSASRSKPNPAAVGGSRKSAESVDESATGSASFGPAAAAACGSVEGSGEVERLPPRRPGCITRISRVPHFRLPAFDHGVVSFVWAVVLGGYIWIGLLAVGVNGAGAFLVAALSAFGFFWFVYLYGVATRAARGEG